MDDVWVNFPGRVVLKKHGFLNTAAIKTIEILDHIDGHWSSLYPTYEPYYILDICGGPGGSAQVFCARDCSVTGITSNAIVPYDHSLVLTDKIDCDILRNRPNLPSRPKFDLAFADGATNAVYQRSSARTHLQLVRAEITIALDALSLGGTLVVKLFWMDGVCNCSVHHELLHRFQTISAFKPRYSRATSNEYYVIAFGYAGMSHSSIPPLLRGRHLTDVCSFETMLAERWDMSMHQTPEPPNVNEVIARVLFQRKPPERRHSTVITASALGLLHDHNCWSQISHTW
jgi:23S rRNA U2552 (ribose-2'-O)-methylase RlmE/FtsJ